MNAIAKAKNSGALTAEQVLIRGDLSALGEAERVKYYADVCHSVGLNPLTKPFEYITLNGKLRLYALKDCTDQLRSLHNVSVTDMAESEREGVFVVKCKVQNGDGRTDMATGAVNIANLKGDALANALMKAETKAKRRATLSICGLGMLDETEVDDIPHAQKQMTRVPSPTEVEKVTDDPAKPVELTPFKDEKFPSWADRFIESINTSKNISNVNEWCRINDAFLGMIEAKAKTTYAKINKAVAAKIASFKPKDDPITSGPQPNQWLMPNIINDYDGWISSAFSIIDKLEDGGELSTFWEQVVQPRQGTGELFPSDYDDLLAAHDKRQEQLNSDE